jgi:hypothetical protein
MLSLSYMSSLPSPDQKISRRDFLKLAGILTASTTLTSCVFSKEQYDQRSQDNISQTATAMVPKTAEQILIENNAPSEVFNRTVSIDIDRGEIISTVSGLILETIEINKKPFALVATAGHAFVDINNKPLTIAGIHLCRPQQNNTDLAYQPLTPVFTTSYVYNSHRDYGFLLIQTEQYLQMPPLENNTTDSPFEFEKLYGLGISSVSSKSAITFEKIPFIVTPDQIQLLNYDRILMIQSSSPGSSGTVLINKNAKPIAIITEGQYFSDKTVCNLFPSEFKSIRQNMIDQMANILSTPPPLPK